MAMYIVALMPAKEDSDVRKLLDALISAKKRGVSVKVILEYHSLIDFTPKGLRYFAYQYLKNNGIDVFFDDSANNCLHAKTIVIDDEIVITGSSNWSEAAFRTSYETNVIVRSRAFAESVLKDLEMIPLRKDMGEKAEDVFHIPISFLDGDSGKLKEMVHYDDERSLDVMLILWEGHLWGPPGSPKVVVEMARRLGLLDEMDRVSWRRQIKKTLKKLEEKYRLIHYVWKHSRDNIEIEFLGDVGDASVKFPKVYFQYGWDKRLSLSSKAVLVTLYSELGNEDGRVISLPILYLSKKYGMKVDTYSKGIQELRRFNIIKVQYGKGFKERADTKISVLGVYDMDEYNKAIDGLRMQYGAREVDAALGYAGIIYCMYDVSIVKDILMQMDKYAEDSVSYAFSYVMKMRPDNYKRSYNYVLGILRRKGVEK
jgi:hypothetical protein